MTAVYQLHLAARAPRRAPWLPRLRLMAGRLLRLPALRPLRSMARRVLAVAEPAGRSYLRSQPEQARADGCRTITVLSANLWHDWPRHRRLTERLEAFARLIEAEGADVVLLQEVARTAALRVDEWLARRLGMAYAYARANGHEAAIGFEEGLAIFSRFPLTTPHLRQLGPGTNPFVRRLALGAALDTPCGSLMAISVHLGLRPRHNAAQLAHLRRWVADVAGAQAALIGGDFNAAEHTAQIAGAQRSWLDTFRHVNPHADATTHELRWPWGRPLRRHRLDYVFLHHRAGRAWEVVEARHLDAPGSPHSDHRAVLARLQPAW